MHYEDAENICLETEAMVTAEGYLTYLRKK